MKAIACIAVAVPALVALLVVNGCALPDGQASASKPAQAPPRAVAAHDGGDHGEHALHNLFEVSGGVWSGSAPEGDAAFDELGAMGVKTVISVDAARPDIEATRARGMRYVHIPVEYAGIDRDEQMTLAKALRDLPRPIYIHCHHGVHRGPTAAAVGLEMTGEISNEAALAFMKTAGTSPNYPGLWACATSAEPVPVSALDAWDAPLPEVAEVGGFVAGMAVLDRAYDRLGLCRGAGWAAPADHPDLVPAALAGQIADVCRATAQGDDVSHYTAEFIEALRQASRDAAALEAAITAGDDAAAEVSWAAVAESCKDCHAVHRNQ